MTCLATNPPPSETDRQPNETYLKHVVIGLGPTCDAMATGLDDPMPGPMALRLDDQIFGRMPHQGRDATRTDPVPFGDRTHVVMAIAHNATRRLVASIGFRPVPETVIAPDPPDPPDVDPVHGRIAPARPHAGNLPEAHSEPAADHRGATRC